MVDIRGRMTRSIYSVTCSGVMFGFWSARYIERELEARALDDGRVLGVGRKLALDLLDLRQDFGQRRVGIGAEPHLTVTIAASRRGSAR